MFFMKLKLSFSMLSMIFLVFLTLSSCISLFSSSIPADFRAAKLLKMGLFVRPQKKNLNCCPGFCIYFVSFSVFNFISTSHSIQIPFIFRKGAIFPAISLAFMNLWKPFCLLLKKCPKQIKKEIRMECFHQFIVPVVLNLCTYFPKSIESFI